MVPVSKRTTTIRLILKNWLMSISLTIIEEMCKIKMVGSNRKQCYVRKYACIDIELVPSKMIVIVQPEGFKVQCMHIYKSHLTNIIVVITQK